MEVWTLMGAISNHSEDIGTFSTGFDEWFARTFPGAGLAVRLIAEPAWNAALRANPPQYVSREDVIEECAKAACPRCRKGDALIDGAHGTVEGPTTTWIRCPAYFIRDLKRSRISPRSEKA